jgi:hypothetical protein
MLGGEPSLPKWASSTACFEPPGQIQAMSREPLLPKRSRKEWLRCLDRIAADLNVLLIMFAIGLAALDLTFLVSQHVVDRLPQVTRAVYADTPAASTQLP